MRSMFERLSPARRPSSFVRISNSGVARSSRIFRTSSCASSLRRELHRHISTLRNSVDGRDWLAVAVKRIGKQQLIRAKQPALRAGPSLWRRHDFEVVSFFSLGNNPYQRLGLFVPALVTRLDFRATVLA